MKGYPSARVRLLRPPVHISPLSSPKKSLSQSPKTANSTAGMGFRPTKVDSKGFVIDHKTSPKKVNHKMPDFDKVYPKIDNRGIDIPKWRNSMLNLRYKYKHVKQTMRINDDKNMTGTCVKKIYF